MPQQKSKKGNKPRVSNVTKTQDVNPTSNSKSDSFFLPSSSKNPESDRQVSKKKVFDKSKWRAQKYSLKSKVEKWQNKRTDHIRHEYMKAQRRRKKPVNFDVQKIYKEEERREKEAGDPEGEDSVGGERTSRKNKKRKAALAIEEEKEEAREKFLKVKAEKEMALERYRKKKLEKHKKLNMKTKKGQPVMKGRMELLLEKIQESLNS